MLIGHGGLPHHNPAVIQVYADVLGHEIEVHPSQQGPAVGAAVLGMIAAGESKSGFASVAKAARAMAAVSADRKKIIRPTSADQSVYDEIYNRYRELARLVQEANRFDR